MKSKSGQTPGERRLALWKDACRGAGVKLTHQRLEIFRELAGRDEHPDAESVFRAVQERVPTVSLDTVYRTLWLLHDLGLITTLGPRQDAIRFDVNLGPHHHFVCLRCGLVQDLPADAFEAVRVPAELARLGGVREARVELRGLCARCEASPSTEATMQRSDRS